MIHKIITAILLIGWNFSAVAQTFPLMENNWNDPSFVKRFMGSYGIHSEIEPRVSFDESEQLSLIIPLVENDVNAAIVELTKFAKPESSAVFDFLLGQMHLQNGNYDLAIVEYEKAIKKFPEFLRAYKNISLAHIQLDQCKKARPHILKVLEMGSADGLNYGFLAHCYFQDEKYATALNAYRMARVFQPDNRDWKIGEAQAFLMSENYNNAIILFDELIVDYPQEERYWMLQANAYMARDDRKKAAANLEIVKRMNKATTDSLLLLGNLYIAEGMPALAYSAFSGALKENKAPEFKKITKAFDYLARASNWSDATLFLTEIKKVYPKNNFQIMEAQLAIGKGNSKQAASILRKIVERDPMDGVALLLLAQNYWDQNDFERAEFMYERAAGLQEFAYEAFRMNARMAVEQNRLEHALGLLQSAAKIKSDDTLQQNIKIIGNAVKAQI